MLSHQEVGNLSESKGIPSFSMSQETGLMSVLLRVPPFRSLKCYDRAAAAEQEAKNPSANRRRDRRDIPGARGRRSGLPPRLRGRAWLRVPPGRTAAEGTESDKSTAEKSKHRGLCWRKARVKPLRCCEGRCESGREPSDEIIH